MNRSLWSGSAALPAFPHLQQDLRTDVLIIGGGMAGILCAYYLTQAGIDCTLVEASSLCSGVTQNTTAKITSQHGLLYHKLLERFGPERARLYWEANERALGEYRRLCADSNCGFEEQTNCVYSTDRSDRLEREMTALEKLRIPARFKGELPLPFSTVGGICFSHQAQFHPLRFLAGLLPGLRIYEHTPVRELVGLTAVTDTGRITASAIVVTTHFPFLNKHGSYFIKMYQYRSYALALENAPLPDGMYVDERDSGFSFRHYGDSLLLGGGGHRTGKQGGSWPELTAFVQRHYPQAVEQYRWAAQDCMTLEGVPYIGQYAKSTPGLYVATGFNKWGMTASMAAALLLRDMIQGDKNPYEELFSPARTILRPQLAVNLMESAVNFLTPGRRCPHLGCALKWNKQEHSWDCPCHGSRFAEDGTLLDNPATNDLKPKRPDLPH